MSVRGTRIIMGEDAKAYVEAIAKLRHVLAVNFGYEEIILSAMWDQQTFIDKAGPEIINQMYAFNDKGDRPICLIPEATAIVDKMYREEWSKGRKDPMKLFYVAKCYRYERPQEGRYREFTQFGVEYLGGKSPEDRVEIETIMRMCLDVFDVPYVFNNAVKRGLDYYVEDGFEAECPILGAQKQVAGGGRFKSGIGFAIGVDRLLLAKKKSNEA